MESQKVLGSNEVAGFADSKEKIIEILEGRPAGHEILPEEHQELALKVLNYVRSVELNAVSTLIGYADENTVPIAPNNSNCAYIGSMGNGKTKTYNNFHGRDGASIQITTDIDHAAIVILLWDWKMSYWSYHLAEITIAEVSEISRVIKFHPGFTTNFTLGGVQAGVEIPENTSVLTVVKNMLFGYIAPTLTISGESENEIGSTINPTINFKSVSSSYAELKKLELYKNGILVQEQDPAVSNTDYSYHDSEIASNTEYEVRMYDDKKDFVDDEEHKKSISVNFYHKYFWGYAGIGSLPQTSQEVRSLEYNGFVYGNDEQTIVGNINTDSQAYYLIVAVPSGYHVDIQNEFGGDYIVKLNGTIQVNIGGGLSIDTSEYKVYYIIGTPSFKNLKIVKD